MRIRLQGRIVEGELWEAPVDLIAVTTNGSVGSRGLVMGRGAARQAAIQYPHLRLMAAESIRNRSLYKDRGRYFVYGFVTTRVEAGNPKVLGLFQVKYDYQESASLALIGYSVIRLNAWLEQYYPGDENFRVAINYPGIGNGRLPEAQVELMLEDLDDRVLIYKLPTEDSNHDFTTRHTPSSEGSG